MQRSIAVLCAVLATTFIIPCATAQGSRASETNYISSAIQGDAAFYGIEKVAVISIKGNENVSVTTTITDQNGNPVRKPEPSTTIEVQKLSDESKLKLWKMLNRRLMRKGYKPYIGPKLLPEESYAQSILNNGNAAAIGKTDAVIIFKISNANKQMRMETQMIKVGVDENPEILWDITYAIYRETIDSDNPVEIAFANEKAVLELMAKVFESLPTNGKRKSTLTPSSGYSSSVRGMKTPAPSRSQP